ncbi:MAG: HAMP domain-containing protein, partial [Candidatus Eremiobacteraeota bacterium]|nr:HAMP domain-containing protein [Candidatus Eremiobacteraeota bacterium]
MSITQRLMALWSALFFVALVVFAALATAFEARSAQIALDDRLLAEAVVTADGIERGSAKIDTDVPRASLAGSTLVLYRNSVPIQIIGERPAARALRQAATIAPDLPVTIVEDDSYRVVTHRIAESSPLRVAAFASEDPVSAEISRMPRTFFIAGLPLVAIAIVAGFFLARRSLSPIDRLTRTAAEVARTRRFSARFDVTTNDELGRLGETFNAMLANLQERYEHERAFIGDVSHELRQPLTAIAADADLSLREIDGQDHRDALSRIVVQARRLRSLID